MRQVRVGKVLLHRTNLMHLICMADIDDNGIFCATSVSPKDGADLEVSKGGNGSTTPIVEKIGKIEKLIIEGKVTLMDDDSKPLKKVDSLT